jgi:hypothetical protein
MRAPGFTLKPGAMVIGRPSTTNLMDSLGDHEPSLFLVKCSHGKDNPWAIALEAIKQADRNSNAKRMIFAPRYWLTPTSIFVLCIFKPDTARRPVRVSRSKRTQIFAFACVKVRGASIRPALRSIYLNAISTSWALPCHGRYTAESGHSVAAQYWSLRAMSDIVHCVTARFREARSAKLRCGYCSAVGPVKPEPAVPTMRLLL